VVTKDGVEFKDAAHLAGKGMYEVDTCCGKNIPTQPCGALTRRVEHLMSNAGISVNDSENAPGRYAGRGGLGAVMGGRCVKAIVIDDKAPRC
jgi:aldehyde:ferredoxin oxidoreductase